MLRGLDNCHDKYANCSDTDEKSNIVARREDGLNMSTCLSTRQFECRTNRTCLIFFIMHPWQRYTCTVTAEFNLDLGIFLSIKQFFSFDGIFPNPFACAENYHFEFSLLPIPFFFCRKLFHAQIVIV